MADIHGFKHTRSQDIPEFKTRAQLFRHLEIGAELLSLSNEDENKVFGITFRTPPYNSTGVAHILEHCVFCGSRKYPVKDPFKELLQGSLQTFMNAYNYADFTCFIAASQNLQDFYNLIDVFLDSVFYPILTPYVFQTEGWRYELEKSDNSLVYKGVVLSEMKGYHSSPETLLSKYCQQSLFPDTPYGCNSGGDPAEIPNLTFKQLKDFHRRYYHPSNAYIYFYGDDDPGERLRIINHYLKDFKEQNIDTTIPLQSSFHQPRHLIRSFPAGSMAKQAPRGIVTMNWVLDTTSNWEKTLAFLILEYILIGMPGSPLRKALMDSKYGESLAGGGLNADLCQSYFSIGLKGINLDDAHKVEALILETLTELTKKGIPLDTIEAAVNRVEFTLRETGTGTFPRGLQLMLRSLTTWFSDGDPLIPLAFKAPLTALKAKISRKESPFERMINRFFLKNNHRTTLIMKPNPGLAQRNENTEKERLTSVRAAMSKKDLEVIIAETKKLKELHKKPDPPEALATIPRLKVAHLDKKNKLIPLTYSKHQGMQILYHNLSTNGVVYLSVGFNLHILPQQYLPYVRLFARALLEIGTETENYVTLTLGMNRTTGGIRPGFFNSSVKASKESSSWLFLQGKSMVERTVDILGIFKDILLNIRLNNRERFRQILLEEKGRQVRKFVPAGHQIINSRLAAHFSEAGWAGELMNGVSYLFFLQKMVEKIDKDWPGVLIILEEMRRILINRNAMFLNVTLDEEAWQTIQCQVHQFIDSLPDQPINIYQWHPENFPGAEGLIIPTQVNFIGKAANLYQLGYKFHGSAFVINRYLETTWLWEQVRVRGGAYGIHCYFDRLSGVFSIISVRDPNIKKTIDVFDQTTHFLKNIDLDENQLTKSIIGAIREFDQFKPPDAKGYTSMIRFLAGVTDVERQRIRAEILSTTSQDFKAFADVLQSFADSGFIKVLTSETAFRDTKFEGMEKMVPIKVF